MRGSVAVSDPRIREFVVRQYQSYHEVIYCFEMRMDMRTRMSTFWTRKFKDAKEIASGFCLAFIIEFRSEFLLITREQFDI